MKTAGSERVYTGLEIAVIGMDGRFPGSRNIDEFWDNIKNGVESISFFKDGEPADPNFVKTKGGVLADKEMFDASFFGYSPKEADVMDPQLRIMHECCWRALEDAGYNPESYDGSIGMYAGAAFNFDWYALAVLSGEVDKIGAFAAGQLTDKDFLCTRIAYKFNLKGPTIAVQAACSTSLVAIHLACRALLTRECDLALAGGVSVSAAERRGYVYQEGMIYSADGHCRAFAAQASGTASGYGAGVVVLKQLKRAREERDHIYAVILGSVVNNDGMRKVGFTAPSVDAQSEVIRAAHYITGIDPETVTYVETHGTGTQLGDPIEIEALHQAFKSPKKGFCRIGSVKSNIGHLGSAAGVASFIKTVLALVQRQIPPSLHFETPNAKIRFENTPFMVNTQLSAWENSQFPLRAGVSSFGMGGTNVHLVLEEAPEVETTKEDSPEEHYQLIVLSANTDSALKTIFKNMSEFCRENPDVNLADVAYTLQAGRKRLEYRSYMVGKNVNEVVETLSSGKLSKLRSKAASRSVIFMFSGLGSQYINMGADLYRHEPIFRQEMDHCFKEVRRLLQIDIKESLYPGASQQNEAQEAIREITLSQVVVLIVEYALARLLMKWGVKPQAMIGYSFGEYTAALAAGVFSLADALKLITARSQCIKKAPPGAMLSIPLSQAELKPYLTEKLSLAIDNGPSCIVSGLKEDVGAFEKSMKKSGYLCMPVQTTQAIHSRIMEPAAREFLNEIAHISLGQPEIPFISNVTGTWIKAAEASDPQYWATHLKSMVRFSDGIKELIKNPGSVFIEIGPGQDLCSLIQRYFPGESPGSIFNLLRHPSRPFSDVRYLMNRVGQMWSHGVDLNWDGFHRQDKRSRLSLPTYPFEGRRYWIEAVPRNIVAPKIPKNKKSENIADWFYLPQWRRSTLPLRSREEIESAGKQEWLVLVDQEGPGSDMVEMLKERADRVTTVRVGDTFAQVEDNEFLLNPGRQQDYLKLFESLKRLNRLPGRIAHFWSLTRESREDIQYRGFFSLIFLAKALGKQDTIESVKLLVVTNQLQEINGEEDLYPEKATLLGPIKVIQQEFPFISCRCLDIVPPEPGSRRHEELLKRLPLEYENPTQEPMIAYRGKYRWVQVFEPLRLDEIRGAVPARLRREGVYLITGGLGRIGLILATYLAESVKARLILVGRSPFPSPGEWADHLARGSQGDLTIQRLKRLQEIESLGGKVLVYSADVEDEERMRDVINRAEHHFGPINGIIHAAGIIGGKTIRLINDIDEDGCWQMFAAKIRGVAVLEKLCRHRNLDFCLLTSSLSPILGGLGFSAYSAANQFMDTFVYRQNRDRQRNWLSVNWADWHFGQESDDIGLSMTPAEGVETFKRILSCDSINQLVVSAGDLNERLSRWVYLESLREEEEGATSAHQRPDLMNPYMAPRNLIEENLVKIWQSLFGFSPVGVQDDFFELGGDSLKAITVISKIHKSLNVAVPLTEFFNGATIEKLAEYVKNSRKNDFRSIDPVEKQEYYELSSQQKRLYFLNQMDMKGIGYIDIQVMMLAGHLDKDIFQQIFLKLFERHENFRTSFFMLNGIPFQRIYTLPDIPFAIETFKAKENEVMTIVEDFRVPFELNRPPLLRVGVIDLANDRFILVYALHHIIMDGTSSAVLMKDFSAIYNGEDLPRLKIQYKDYASWQNKKEQKEALKSQEAYWLKEFAGGVPVLNLPYDYARPPIRSFEGDSSEFSIGETDKKALKELAATADVTLYMLLLAIFYVFLAKVCGAEDIVVGTVVAGRQHEDLENTLGIFINLLALRNFPGNHKTFREFLQEVKLKTLQAFENQLYQFEDLAEKVAVDRDVSRNPLFDVFFQFGNIERPELKIPQLKLEGQGFAQKTSRFDLTLFTSESGKDLAFTFEYTVRLFKSETIRGFRETFCQLVTAILTDPDQKLSSLKEISEKKKKEMLAQFGEDLEDEYADMN
jgi:acyl transferase domain-containing protein/acyl carrier protein